MRTGRRVIEGRLERPGRRQLYSRWLDVRGWARAVSGEALVVRIAMNGRLLGEFAADGGGNGGGMFEGVVSL